MIRTVHPSRPVPELPPGAPWLELDAIDVHYDGVRAAAGVSLRVDRGEVVALLGANGAGKTTSLRAIARLAPVSSGAVRFAGRDITGEPTEAVAALGVSLVPEGRGIFGRLTVRENLELGAYVHRDPGAMRETLDDVVTLFPRIGERLAQRAGTLSGGEQQMLAIGRALMARPSLLLLDEPSLGIAPRLCDAIFDAIVTVAKSGVTTLLVEQNTQLALEASQRAYVLKAGRVALSGRSEDLLRDPEVQAAYLGTPSLAGTP